MQRSPIVYFLFFASGVTALIYEIVWTRMLTLVFGHTVFSVSVVLAAFMAGLGLGSYLFGYAADRLSSSSSALRVYGWIEVLIFASGALLSLLYWWGCLLFFPRPRQKKNLELFFPLKSDTRSTPGGGFSFQFVLGVVWVG